MKNGISSEPRGRVGTRPGEKIRRMFSDLAPEYDRFNRWSSLGLDGVWRRRLAGEIFPGRDVLDLGAGTGALSVLAGSRVPRNGSPSARVVGLDFSYEMLARARTIARDSKTDSPSWVQARVEELPFPSGSFDVVVSAYVLRNLQKAGILAESLREAHRVLRSGGRALFLDLTRPRRRLWAWGHRLYLRTAVPAIGRWLFGARWPGDYLRDSIDDFPPERRIRELFESAGFRDFRVRLFFGGVAALFAGVKEC